MIFSPDQGVSSRCRAYLTMNFDRKNFSISDHRQPAIEDHRV